MQDINTVFTFDGTGNPAEFDCLPPVNQDVRQSSTPVSQLVVCSLLTDARAEAADLPPGYPSALQGGYVGGYWAQSYHPTGAAGIQLGALLWTLRHKGVTAATLKRAEAYALTATRWIVQTGIASLITATAQRVGTTGIGIVVDTYKDDTLIASVRFAKLWT